jgi:predicted nucleic acid-binding protein
VAGLLCLDASLGLTSLGLPKPEGLLEGTWLIGRRLGLLRLHDTSCLALGALLDSEVWAVDRRLGDRVHPHFPFLRWVGHVQG